MVRKVEITNVDGTKSTYKLHRKIPEEYKKLERFFTLCFLVTIAGFCGMSLYTIFPVFAIQSLFKDVYNLLVSGCITSVLLITGIDLCFGYNTIDAKTDKIESKEG